MTLVEERLSGIRLIWTKGVLNFDGKRSDEK
jgi:hypothetical protein